MSLCNGLSISPVPTASSVSSSSTATTRQSIRTVRRNDITTSTSSSSISVINYDNNDSPCSIDQTPDGVIRVGTEYQADIPHLLTETEKEKYVKERKFDAIQAWAPVDHIKDSVLDEYVSIAKERHDYSHEQAYAMLVWHKFSIEKSLADLPNFVPAQPDWSAEDRSLFEQAFTFYGKNFSKVRSMMSDKSIKDLILYYYRWKKRRYLPSLMDKGERKRENTSEEDLDTSMTPEVDGTKTSPNNKDTATTSTSSTTSSTSMTGLISNGCCSHCTATSYRLHTTPRGTLCSSCYDYYIQTSSKLPPIPPASAAKSQPTGGVTRKRRCPNGIYLEPKDLKMLSTEGPSLIRVFLKDYEKKAEKGKRELQLEKQVISDLKESLSANLPAPSKLILESSSQYKYTVKWSVEEQSLCKLAIRSYGRDYSIISDIIGTKSEYQVRTYLDQRVNSTDVEIDELMREKRMRGETTEMMTTTMPTVSTMSTAMPLSDKKNMPDVEYLETKLSSSSTIRPARFIPTRAASSSSTSTS